MLSLAQIPDETLSSPTTHRAAIRRIVASHRAHNPRVFGSVLRGEDDANSDLDLLVDPLQGTTLFDLGAIQIELAELLGVAVDLVVACTLKNASPSFSDDARL